MVPTQSRYNKTFVRLHCFGSLLAHVLRLHLKTMIIHMVSYISHSNTTYLRYLKISYRRAGEFIAIFKNRYILLRYTCKLTVFQTYEIKTDKATLFLSIQCSSTYTCACGKIISKVLLIS